MPAPPGRSEHENGRLDHPAARFFRARDLPPRVSHGDTAEFVAIDPLHSIVLGEALIDEGVIGGQQVQNCTVLPHDTGEEQLRLPDHRDLLGRGATGERDGSVGRQGSTADLEAETIALSHGELRERMSGNLCRCGAYNGIVDAIHETFGDLATPVPKREAA